MALKRFDHESCIKSAQLKLLRCLISHNFNRGVVFDEIFLKKGIGVVDVEHLPWIMVPGSLIILEIVGHISIQISSCI